MKGTIFLSILLVSSLGAVEVTALGGGNYQAWFNEGEAFLEGISWHAGGLVSEGVTFRRIPFTLSAETGILYQRDKYVDKVYFYDSPDEEPYDSATYYWGYHNLVVPVFLKGSVDFLSRFNIGLGPGISFVRPLSGRIWNEAMTYEMNLRRSDMDTYLACLIKGEVGFKIMPRMWLKASVTGQYKIADLTGSDFVDKGALFASLGLAYRI